MLIKTAVENDTLYTYTLVGDPRRGDKNVFPLPWLSKEHNHSNMRSFPVDMGG